MPKTFETNSFIKDRQVFEIIQRSPDPNIRGVKIGGHEVPFGKKSRAARITDAGLAHAIHDSSGQGGTRDVLVIPVESRPEKGHPRSFLMPSMPWHKEKE